jgi:hypothetical protein
VKGDLRLKSRSDPEFPNDKTFDRIGTNPELVSELLEDCRSQNGYDDIVRLCEEYANDRRQSSAAPDPREEESEIGFVYLVKSGRFFKIGKTNSAGRREREIVLQLPEKAMTVHVIRTDDPIGIEAYWYNRFEAKRKNGEWFDLTGADVSAFKRRNLCDRNGPIRKPWPPKDEFSGWTSFVCPTNV